MGVANLQTAPIAGFGFAFDRHFLAYGGVTTCAIVYEADADNVIAVALELVTEVIFIIRTSLEQNLAILLDQIAIGPARIGVVQVHVAVLDCHGAALYIEIPFGFAQITATLFDGDFFANGLFASSFFASDSQTNVVCTGLGVGMFGVSTCAGMAITKIPAVAEAVRLHDLELVFPIAVVLHHEVTFDVAG